MRAKGSDIGTLSFCHILYMCDYSFILSKVIGDKKGKRGEKSIRNLRRSSDE